MSIFALQQAIADDGTGTPHPNAIYTPAEVIMDLVAGLGSVVWRAHHDAASLFAGKAELAQCRVSQQLDHALFQLDSDFQLTPVNNETYGAATTASLNYVALNCKDKDTGQKDTNNLPIMESSFKNATVVQIG